MMRLPAWLVLTLVVAAVLPAQDKKPPKAKPESAKAEVHKDDATTTNDRVVAAIDKFIAQKGPSKKGVDWRTSLAEPPLQKFDADREYYWHMQTNQGPVVIQLFPDTAPRHVTCAIYLVRLGYYDGLTFHRVITQFMAQGGCPLGTGSGGPGYLIDGEFDGGRKHDRPGMLSTANRGPATDGSQFFLTFVKTPHLDGKHTIYGAVVEGMDTLQKLEAAGSAQGKPTMPLTMDRNWITVVAKKTEKPAEKPAEKPKGEPGK